MKSNNIFCLGKFFLLIIAFLLQCNLGICQKANLVGFSYSRSLYVHDEDKYGNHFSVKKNQPSFGLNYFHNIENPHISFSGSLGYTPYKYSYHYEHDSVIYYSNSNLITRTGRESKFKSNNLSLSGSLLLMTSNEVFKLFFGEGFMIESSLSRTTVVFDSLEYGHNSYYQNHTFYLPDSTEVIYRDKKAYGISPPTYCAFLQFGFRAKLNPNFCLLGSFEIIGFFKSSLLSNSGGGLIFPIKLGLYYKLPSKEKPYTIPN